MGVLVQLPFPFRDCSVIEQKNLGAFTKIMENDEQGFNYRRSPLLVYLQLWACGKQWKFKGIRGNKEKKRGALKNVSIFLPWQFSKFSKCVKRLNGFVANGPLNCIELRTNKMSTFLIAHVSRQILYYRHPTIDIGQVSHIFITSMGLIETRHQNEWTSTTFAMCSKLFKYISLYFGTVIQVLSNANPTKDPFCISLQLEQYFSYNNITIEIKPKSN